MKLPATGQASTAPPVLVVAPASAARTIQAALGSKVAITSTDAIDRARALAATGGFVAIVAVEPLASSIGNAIVIDPADDVPAIASAVIAAIGGARTHRDEQPIAGLAYEEYIELARYAMTRRYLIALLHRHRGSVTDAARGAEMKRESLHRLMRRHHLNADDFRDR